MNDSPALNDHGSAVPLSIRNRVVGDAVMTARAVGIAAVAALGARWAAHLGAERVGELRAALCLTFRREHIR